MLLATFRSPASFGSYSLTFAQIKPDEMKVIVDSFKDPGHVQKEGAKVNGQKYTFIRGDARTLLLKKVPSRRIS